MVQYHCKELYALSNSSSESPSVSKALNRSPPFFVVCNRRQLSNGPERAAVAAVLDDLLGGGGTDSGELVEFFGACCVDVHEKRGLRFGFCLLKGGAVDDLWGRLGDAGGVVCAPGEHKHDEGADEDLGFVTREKARRKLRGAVPPMLLRGLELFGHFRFPTNPRRPKWSRGGSNP